MAPRDRWPTPDVDDGSKEDTQAQEEENLVETTEAVVLPAPRIVPQSYEQGLQVAQKHGESMTPTVLCRESNPQLEQDEGVDEELEQDSGTGPSPWTRALNLMRC